MLFFKVRFFQPPTMMGSPRCCPGATKGDGFIFVAAVGARSAHPKSRQKPGENRKKSRTPKMEHRGVFRFSPIGTSHGKKNNHGFFPFSWSSLATMVIIPDLISPWRNPMRHPPWEPNKKPPYNIIILKFRTSKSNRNPIEIINAKFSSINSPSIYFSRVKKNTHKKTTFLPWPSKHQWEINGVAATGGTFRQAGAAATGVAIHAALLEATVWRLVAIVGFGWEYRHRVSWDFAQSWHVDENHVENIARF